MVDGQPREKRICWRTLKVSNRSTAMVDVCCTHRCEYDGMLPSSTPFPFLFLFLFLSERLRRLIRGPRSTGPAPSQTKPVRGRHLTLPLKLLYVGRWAIPGPGPSFKSRAPRKPTTYPPPASQAAQPNQRPPRPQPDASVRTPGWMTTGHLVTFGKRAQKAPTDDTWAVHGGVRRFRQATRGVLSNLI